MVFIKEHKGCLLILLSIFITSCEEPFGVGGQLHFYPQTCEILNLTADYQKDSILINTVIIGQEAPHDPALEDMISSWDHWVSGSSIYWRIRYTDEIIDSIRITSTERVFCQEPGQDLSPFFTVRGDGSPDALILSSNQYIGSFPKEGLSIDDYLKYSPLVAPSMILFSESVNSGKVERIIPFTVCFLFRSGKQLSNTVSLNMKPA